MSKKLSKIVEERKKTRRVLDYCGLDTYSMVKVWEKQVEVNK